MNQKVNQNDIMKPARIYWQNLKLLIVRPNQFYLIRKPSTNWHFMLLSCLPPIFLMSLAAGLIAQKLWLPLIYLVGAYAAIAILVVIEKYLLLIFDERRSFVEILDIVASTAPALILAWIPQYGVPMACLLVGFWNWKALSLQFKMGPGAALLGTALPAVLFIGFLLALLFVVSWLTALGQLFAPH